MKGIASVGIDTEPLIQEMTSAQAETLVGGYCPPNEDYPSVYIINITRFKKKLNKPTETTNTNDISNQKINTIDNSRKIYINGVPIKGEKNIIIIY